LQWFDSLKNKCAKHERGIRVTFALVVIGIYFVVGVNFVPTIISDYNEITDSVKLRTFQFPINFNLNGTLGFFEPDVTIGLTITYPNGILIVDEPVNVNGHAVLNNKTTTNVSAIVVTFQNALRYPINYTYEGIPRQGFTVFNSTDRFLDYSRITGEVVYNILGNSTIVWSIDGESKPIIGIFYNDGTNETIAIQDLSLHVYPKEQLTQVQTNKVTTELTFAVFIFAFFGVFSIASDIWPRKPKACKAEPRKLTAIFQKSQELNPDSN
jgi:hypothetical protein